MLDQITCKGHEDCWLGNNTIIELLVEELLWELAFTTEYLNIPSSECRLIIEGI